MTALVSICMTNYNMADTLEKSILSIVNQVDNRFEIVVVDDGSTDNSLEVLYTLSNTYDIIKVVPLERDSNRKLGFTRNISIQSASGIYVMLHLDCDDVFGPYLVDFFEIFLRIESSIDHDILLSGQHINIAKRDFLLSHGPYINIYRGEDRNLWSRLAKINSWIPFDHVDFVTRLPKRNVRVKVLKNIRDTFDHMKNDFCSGVGIIKYIKYEIDKRMTYSRKLFIFRLMMLFPAKINSLFCKRIDVSETIGSPEAFAEYRSKTRGTFLELMTRFGGDKNVDFLTRKDSRDVYKIYHKQ